MNLSLEQLKALLAAAETGSFSAAARHLGKAQSVVSSAIANLEIDLGVELFDRRGRYPVLTAAGERLLVEARAVLASSEQLQAVAHELHGGVEARLTLAIDDDSQLPWVAEVLERFAQTFPAIELELLFPMLEDLTHLLREGRAQLGISYERLQASRDLEFHALGRLRLPIVVAPDHPLARLARVGLGDLKGERQLMVTGQRGGGERERFRFAPSVWWVEGDWGVLELIKRGLGWGSVPEYLLQGPLARGEVVVLPVDFLEQQWSMGLELLWRRDQPLGPAGRWLREARVAHARKVFRG